MSNIASAVQFLRDPNVQTAPLQQKIQFLENKGLNKQEIDQALQQAQSPTYAPFPQQAPPYDWRDWFIMTVVGGGLAWLGTALARKYLVPALSPPDQTQLQDAQDALTKKYDEAAALLEQIKADAAETKASVLAQQSKVDKSLDEVQEAVAAFKLRDEERSEELKACKEEVESLKEQLPKMLEKTKDAQTQSLTELHAELKSLKALLSSSKASEAPRFGLGTSPFGGGKLNGGLPAWQLAGHNQLKAANGSAPATPPEDKEEEESASSTVAQES